MAGFGRTPKPANQRRNHNPGLRGGLLQLPRDGRTGVAPEWPLAKTLKAERDLWARIWATPQAVAWEALGWNDVVARYVRLTVAANERDAKVTLLGEVRQLEDRLGLSPMAMLRLRWQIEEESPADGQDEAADSGVLDIRKRLAGG